MKFLSRVSWLALTLLLTQSKSASGQTDAQQKAAAEALFDEGRQLLGQGQYETACRRFEQSQAVDPGVGTLLYLGDCYERSGKLASAWAIFREASSAAQAAGQGDRSRIADERARKLSPNLSKLALLVSQENRVAGFEVLLDGKLLSSALFGVPFPVDAGRHELSARAPGKESWSSLIDIKPGGDYQNVQVPALAPTPGMGATLSGNFFTPGAPSGVGVDAPASASRQGPSSQQLVGIGFAAGGLVAVGVGALFGLSAASKDDEAKAGCAGDRCYTREAAELNDDARSAALIANVSYGVGVAALATGAILYFSSDTGAGSEQARQRPPRLAPAFGRHHGMALVSGEF
jgi:serine/threonine-protein kinase